MSAAERPQPAARTRRRTATSSFGVGKREGHDATAFYQRFKAPKIVRSDEVTPPEQWPARDTIAVGDMRQRTDLWAPNSVALVVTSPPYYAGKDYETAIGQGHVPASYQQYLEMLHGVFSACVEALEPGGRIAVNVANLGRKPYRSLSRDIIDIFEDLELLLRGEVVWQKAKGAGGNCAWGTYQRPGDPVLRDVTERVVIASKLRFDRAIEPKQRELRGMPSEASIFRDEFLDATLDLWELAPESARAVNHPAPFPVELPQRFIELYTYRGDLVVDPFMGSGSTAVAALRSGRHYLGFDTDEPYVAAANERLRRLAEDPETVRQAAERPTLHAFAALHPPAKGESVRARALREGRRVKELVEALLLQGGLTVLEPTPRLAAGVETTFVAEGRDGRRWAVDVVGSFSSGKAGLRKADNLWRVIGKATVLANRSPEIGYVVASTDVPTRASAGGRALAAVTRSAEGAEPAAATPLWAVIDLSTQADANPFAVLNDA